MMQIIEHLFYPIATVSIIRTIINRKNHIDSYERNIRDIKNNKPFNITKIINSVFISESKNYVSSEKYIFNFDLYNQMEQDISYLEYFSNFDLILKFFNKNEIDKRITNKIKYNIAKRKYYTTGYGGYCMGMSCKMIKAALSNDINSINFSNGPDYESIRYQILHLNTPFNDIYYGDKLLYEINSNLYKKIGIKSVLKINKLDNLREGVYLIIVDILNIGKHAVVLIKTKNFIMFFDPNIGLLKYYNEKDITNFINNTYGNNKIILYKMELR